MAKFKYDLKQRVRMVESDESGTVVGRAEYADPDRASYLVRYKAGDGCQRENWWAESDITE